MVDTIKHQGIVKNINGSHVSVRIIQTSACSSCSVKGHCSSADSKEKIVDVIAPPGTYHIGEEVMLIGATSMGLKAVLLAFVVPFLLLVISLFLFMEIMNNDLWASLFSLGILIPYYAILWLNKSRLKQQFSFTIKPINN
ncbi:SoxR reducing system RseC family protein [Bacteroides sp.]|uniref:SoxR reducing system RseC family protein n=1 Tax=Bacteroides sp. TaxID=29523 RepID=UPI002FC952AB